MSESLIPPWITPADDGEDCEWPDDSGVQFRPRFGPGPSQRQSYGGPRLMVRRRHKSCRGEERSILTQALAQADGRTNVIRTKIHQALRGSFPAVELLTNNTFANGTTGWSTFNASSSISVSDRVLRSQVVSGPGIPFISQQVTGLTQYAPHVARALIAIGRGQPFTGEVDIGSSSGNNDYAGSTSPLIGSAIYTAAGVVLTTNPFFGAGASSQVGRIAGDHLSIPYTSLSRCALADKGPNALLRSDEFDNAAWTKGGCTITANADTAPDGTAAGDALIEDGANSSHDVSQAQTVSSAAQDVAIVCAAKANGRNFCRLQLFESSSGTAATQYFGLASGTVLSMNVGANWSSVRSFVVSLGANWYLCCMVARKTNAATTLTAFVGAASADNIGVYTGSSSAAINIWRGTSAPSSVPIRLTQTTTAATTGTAQTGSALHIKGLPASTNGLLLPDDWFEINGELKQCTAALNSDAAGLGYLQFKPDLVRSPADNDPIIICNPMGKFILASSPKKSQRFTTQSDIGYDLEHIYE